MSKKQKLKQKETIARLEEELAEVDREYLDVIRELNSLRFGNMQAPTAVPSPSLVDEIRAWKNRYPKYSATISIDLLPIQDWFRLEYNPFYKGKAAQITIGPLRGDFYQS